ncbi:MAG TPA: hypothetical protein VER33_21930 [Polyangiaceae bacterium]|nr:hypothetical protein [Polyangiaceae bacterium]
MKSLLAAAALLLTLFVHASAQAETMVYIHGWNPWLVKTNFQDCQDQTTCNYWSSSHMYSEPNVTDIRHVGWNTLEDDWRYFPVEQARRVLDNRCVGDSCTIICHSTGCAIAGKVLDQYGAGGSRWRVNRVLTLGSAEGGSELADLQFSPAGVVSYLFTGPSSFWLRVGTVRGAYDHNDTAGAPFFHVAGYDGGWFLTATVLPGQDDGVVPFHSACGYVKAFWSTQCSNDWEWVRKTSWGVPYYVQRTVARWTNHTRVEYCGRDGCNQHHLDIYKPEFQKIAVRETP